MKEVENRDTDRKKKRTKSSVWFQYAKEKGVDPHKSAWSDYARKTASTDGKKEKHLSIRFCTKCGAQLKTKSKFCERCGRRIK
ncbi:MAG: zinc ribbon domain-containing protein [Candidatus Hodarchaeales archaeon]|jgi:hypothetical protein